MSLIVISKSAFVHNFECLRELVSVGVIAPVIKGNAYGHGLVQLGQLSQKIDGIEWVCVFNLSEVRVLRQSGYCKWILVMGHCDAVEFFNDEKIAVMVDTLEQIAYIDRIGQLHGKSIMVHVKVDTGLSRFGLSIDEVEIFFKKVKDYAYIHVQGIYTHCSQSQLEDQSYTEFQLKQFNHCLTIAESFVGQIQYVHAYNSAATIVRGLGGRYNFFRIGLALYGYCSSPFVARIMSQKNHNKLRPILTLSASIIGIKSVRQGSYIGYNNEFQAPCDMRIGIIGFGYYDGYDPLFKHGGQVVIKGKYCNLIGRVAMNVIVVDLGTINAVVGDRVDLIHPALLPADKLCVTAGISNVRTFLCRLNSNITRVIV